MEEEFLKILLERKQVNTADVVRELKLNISNEGLDALVEELYARGIIGKPHTQHRDGRLPNYDRIVLTEDGGETIKKLLKE